MIGIFWKKQLSPCLHDVSLTSKIHGTGICMPTFTKKMINHSWDWYIFTIHVHGWFVMVFKQRHTYTRQPWMRHGWHLAALPKVEEDGSARHKKKCPPSPVWETQILSVELFVQMLGEGWGGVEAKIYCSCIPVVKKMITRDVKPVAGKEQRDTSRNSKRHSLVMFCAGRLGALISAGLLKWFLFFWGGSGWMWKTRRMVGHSRLVAKYVWQDIFSSPAMAIVLRGPTIHLSFATKHRKETQG